MTQTKPTRKMAYVYVLHYDVKLSHAEHYIGSTASLHNRLKTHAKGQGSRLTRELYDQQIHWVLGAVYQTSYTGHREVERWVKNQNNGPRFCKICTPDGTTPPNLTPYPISELPFATNFHQLATQNMPFPGPIRVEFIHEFTPNLQDTLKYIDETWKKDRNALGFIPLSGWELAAKNDNLAVVKNNNELVGYACFHLSHDDTRLTFAQVCIQDDARALHHGTVLVNAIAANNPNATQRAVVKDQLPANAFWTSIGFTKARQTKHKTSNNKLNHYVRKPVWDLPFTLKG